MRILCTGSREWTDEATVLVEITKAHGRIAPNLPASAVTVVHGGCPRGADAIVDKVARDLGYTVEVHPANTRAHGSPLAFYLRNQEMVDEGASVCLAFWCPGGAIEADRNAMDEAKGRGTADTFTRAAIAGIPVRICVPRKP